MPLPNRAKIVMEISCLVESLKFYSCGIALEPEQQNCPARMDTDYCNLDIYFRTMLSELLLYRMVHFRKGEKKKNLII